jgi:hypothetical protein
VCPGVPELRRDPPLELVGNPFRLQRLAIELFRPVLLALLLVDATQQEIGIGVGRLPLDQRLERGDRSRLVARLELVIG